jgi:uncharacterized protein with HEPN domain
MTLAKTAFREFHNQTRFLTIAGIRAFAHQLVNLTAIWHSRTNDADRLKRVEEQRAS